MRLVSMVVIVIVIVVCGCGCNLNGVVYGILGYLDLDGGGDNEGAVSHTKVEASNVVAVVVFGSGFNAVSGVGSVGTVFIVLWSGSPFSVRNCAPRTVVPFGVSGVEETVNDRGGSLFGVRVVGACVIIGASVTIWGGIIGVGVTVRCGHVGIGHVNIVVIVISNISLNVAQNRSVFVLIGVWGCVVRGVVSCFGREGV